MNGLLFSGADPCEQGIPARLLASFWSLLSFSPFWAFLSFSGLSSVALLSFSTLDIDIFGLFTGIQSQLSHRRRPTVYISHTFTSPNPLTSSSPRHASPSTSHLYDFIIFTFISVSMITLIPSPSSSHPISILTTTAQHASLLSLTSPLFSSPSHTLLYPFLPCYSLPLGQTLVCIVLALYANCRRSSMFDRARVLCESSTTSKSSPRLLSGVQTFRCEGGMKALAN